MNDDRAALAEAVSNALSAATEGGDFTEAPEPSDEPGSPYVYAITDSLLAAGVTLRSEGPGLDAPSLDERRGIDVTKITNDAFEAGRQWERDHLAPSLDEGLLAGTFSCPLGCGLIDMAALDNHLASHGYTYRVWSKRERP